ncbi:hypothetical protein Agub_g5693 [Astrephomene gubernaculifera]|uniref:Uncharacterized protein n=1 Tax=Astrephomene gubernaculifera TaxID=47775 RepID=A0AAD3DMP3_9CHLO|nr:hypothetical protein Agub_g5693 [Astrephomene gubernaculifera]
MQGLTAGRTGWRLTDPPMDAESVGNLSVTSSVERQAMREQLDTVRQTLNSLANGAQPSAGGVSGPSAQGLDGVLANIATKLNNIEGLYTSLTDKLEKVDVRIEDSERHIKDLQHFSASTINETARLVDFVGGGRGTSPNTRSGSLAGGMASRSRPYVPAGMPSTPPPAAPSSSARSPLPALEYVPGHLSGTLQQHAAQIHKLIAGLDFLEAHIIRQDQAVEGLQKQLITVARDVTAASPTADSRAPSEVSLRVHDLEELVHKLRSHLFKVDKRSVSHDQALGTITSRIEALAGRFEASEAGGGREQAQEGAEGDQAASGASAQKLSAALEEQRGLLLGLTRDVQELRDQLQALTQHAQEKASGPSSEAAAEMQQQLTYLMSVVPALVEENKSLKEFAAQATQQLAELTSGLEEQRQQASQVAAVAEVREQVARLDTRLEGFAPLEELQKLSTAMQARAPAAEVLAAEVASAARANLEERFGQLRHRTELAAEAADAASKRSEQSAAAAAAAVVAAEAAGQKGASSTAEELKERVRAVVEAVEKEQAALKDQFTSLASQLSQEQGAIASGLGELQEQVTAAAAAATDAVSCAQQVQELQAASCAQEQAAAEARQAELRDQVANVMEHLKERVEQAMQQMDLQVSALSEQLSGAIRAEHFEAALQQVRAIASDSAERVELALASIDECRSELILLTGQQDVVQSRLQTLESAVGVNPRASTARSAPTSTPREADVEGEGGAGGLRSPDAADAGAVQGARASPRACASPVGRGGNGGLLDLVAELRTRVTELEGAVSVAAGLQQATTRLLEDLEGLTSTMDGINGRVALVATNYETIVGVSTALQQRVADQTVATEGLASQVEEQQVRVEEMVARLQETSAAVSALSARVARDYINREQLGAIFQARADIKRAVNVLGSVFDTGRMLREASMDDVETQVPSPSTDSRSDGRPMSPRLASALDGLRAKQAELEHQVHLALYRSDGAVRQEQLAGVQQAMMSLEMQFRRQQSSQQQQPQSQQPSAVATDAAVEQLRARVEALEASLAASSSPTAAAAAQPAAAPAASGSGAPACSRSPSSSAGGVRLQLSQEDLTDANSPVRVRLAVDEPEADAQPPAVPEPEAPATGVEEEAEVPVEGAVGESGEPSLSQLLLDAPAAAEASSGDLQAAPSAVGGVQELQRSMQELSSTCEELQSRLATEAAERLRLTEAVSELQERVDLQVNAMASTAAVVATLATDQQHQRVRLQVHVAGPEAEEFSALAGAVSTLAARVEAMEDSLESAFVVRSPRSPKRGGGAAVAAAAASASAAADGADPAADDAVVREEAGEEEEEEEAGPALGLMVPVLPREIEEQLAALQAQVQRLGAEVGALGGRVEGLEAAGALDEVGAAASQVVLEAIPGLVEQQVALLREEVVATGLVERKEVDTLVELAGQSAGDAAEAVLAVRGAAQEAVAAREAAEKAAREAVAAATEAAVGAVRQTVAEEVGAALARLQQGGAGSVATAAAAVEVGVQPVEELAAGVRRVEAEAKDIRLAVEVLTERMNDLDTLRDQLEALAEQIRSVVAPDADGGAGSSSQQGGGGGTPNAAAVASIFTPAATAWVLPSKSPNAGASPVRAARQPAPQPSTSQQAAFLARLVEVVKRQSSRLHAQYTDAEETGVALAQVDHTLEEAEARLADVRDANSPAFAETLVTVLEQVAALRYIGSQTHPAVQQMVLEHENRLDAIATQLKNLATTAAPPAHQSGAEPATATAAAVSDLAEVVTSVSSRVARLEAEVGLLAGQHAALDQAVSSMLSFAESVREHSASAATTASGSSSSDDPDAPAALAPDAAGAVAASAGSATAAALEVAALSARVRLLDESLSARMDSLRQELLAEATSVGSTSGGAAGAGGGGAAAAADVSALEGKVAQLHAAATAMRNRLLAVQEYVDSTQGMIKDMHVALGGLHRRVDALEGAAGGPSSRVSGSGSGSADPASLRELQSELAQLQIKLLSVESNALEAAHALAALRGLAPRVTDAESRLADVGSKLALALGGSSSSSHGSPRPFVIPAPGPGTSLPAVASAVRALERRVSGRLEATCSALDSLAGALSAASRIQAESTANPFKAISAAVNNPVVVALEKKVEALRTELHTVINVILEDLRRDQQQSKAASLDASVSSSSGQSYRA